MGYREELKALVDRYFQDILEQYKQTTMEATQLGKKLSLFKKQNFSVYIAGFKDHQLAAERILKELKPLQVPADDKDADNLKTIFVQSLTDFIKLCERNADHYDLMDKKQYAKNKVKPKDIKFSAAGVSAAMGPAIESLDIMNRAYMIFNGEEVVVEEEDLLEQEETDEVEEVIEEDPEEKSVINQIADDVEAQEERSGRNRPHVYGKQNFQEEEE